MKNFSFLFLFIASIVAHPQTIYTNVEWSTQSGEPDSIPWSHTVKDNGNSIVMVGNKKNPQGNTDIYIVKMAADGQVEWEKQIDHNGGDDYAARAAIDFNGDIVVAATVWESPAEKFNYAVLKFDNNGNPHWVQTFNGTGSGEDIPTAIAVDGSNNIYITGGSVGLNTAVDIATLKYDPSGNWKWTRTYDFNSLHDAAGSIDVKGNRVTVGGGSQSSVAVYDGVSIQYSDNGAHLGTYRTSFSVGITQPTAIVHDAAGNYYVSGWHSLSPTDKRWTIIKLDSNLNAIWDTYYNPGNGNDEAADMCLGPDGNLWVSGHATNEYGTTDGRVVRFDQSSGTLLTETSLSGQEGSATILKLETNGNHVAFVGERWKGTEHRLVCGEINQSGNIRWMREPHSARGGRAMEILSDYAGNLYITGQTFLDNTNSYIALQITTYEHNPAPVVDGHGKPLYLDNELLIRFSPHMMKENMANNRDAEWGNLSRFVKQEVIDSMNTLVGFEFGRQKAMKIFRGLTPADSMAEARDGTMVRQQPFWTCLKVALPAGTDEQTLGMDLEQFFPLIFYTDLNLLGEFHSVPNDPKYPNQASLHSTNYFPDGHINIEEAWELETGKPEIRVGIFDTGIEWDHEDFGYLNGVAGSSRVKDGWDFKTNSSLMINPHADSASHGTGVAGILGAVRNNGIGIPGVAGGHDSTDATFAQEGVSLYGLRISFLPSAPLLDYVADAIVQSSVIIQGGDYNYGNHINNFSWSISSDMDQYTDTNIELLRDAVNQAYKNKVVQVASRGNEGNDDPSLPATFDDTWIMNISGTGYDGNFAVSSNAGFWSNYARNVDVAAPATVVHGISGAPDFMQSLNSSPFSNNLYQKAGGTSGAAPHVSGTAALLLSYLNDPLNGFTLEQEDVESIIQMSATSLNGTTPNDMTGYGRLNAGAALKLVEKPDKKIWHFAASNGGSCSVGTYAVGVSLNLLEKYTSISSANYNSGSYQADIYKVSCTVSHTLGIDDSIVASWPRSASSTVMRLYNAANGSLLPRDFVSIASLSQTQAALEGYIYHLKDTASGTPIGWIPRDTSLSAIEMEYSILTHKIEEVIEDTTDTNDTTVTVPPIIHENDVRIFPNPAEDNVTISLQIKNATDVVINMHSVDGKLIKSVYNGIMSPGMKKVDCSLSGIANGVYFYEVRIGNDRSVHRFTKY